MFALHPCSSFRPPFSKGTWRCGKSASRHPWCSLDQAFSKACGVKGRSPSRAPQSAKLSLRRFSFLRTFFFCAYMVKRKKWGKTSWCVTGYLVGRGLFEMITSQSPCGASSPKRGAFLNITLLSLAAQNGNPVGVGANSCGCNFALLREVAKRRERNE